MDTFEINNFKVQKTNGNLKHRQLRKIANLIRMIEICALVVLVSRFSIQLTLVVQNSSKYFKDLTVVLVSPLFAFIIGNMIVVFLFAQLRQFSGQDSTRKNPGSNSYAEFSEKVEKTKDTYRYEAQYREKQNICEEKVVADGTYSSCKHRSYRRILSENSKRVSSDKPCRELRRSGTEKYRKSTNSGKRLVKNSYPEDNMSNEEFRHMIEAFITKQRNFRLKEEYSVI